MVKVIEEGINSILEENGYPELSVRVGIDVGENAVVQYGLKTNNNIICEEKNANESKYETKSNQIDKDNKTNTPKKISCGYIGIYD